MRGDQCSNNVVMSWLLLIDMLVTDSDDLQDQDSALPGSTRYDCEHDPLCAEMLCIKVSCLHCYLQLVHHQTVSEHIWMNVDIVEQMVFINEECSVKYVRINYNSSVITSPPDTLLSTEPRIIKRNVLIIHCHYFTTKCTHLFRVF